MSNTVFSIDGHEIGGARVFVIAEIGNNHNGSLELAKQLVDAAIEAGADCAKFQLRDRSALYRTKADGSVAEDLGVEYIQDLLNKVELSIEDHRAVRDYCAQRGITYMCTPWDEPSVDVLAGFDVPALKIASADLCNPYLIRKAASLGKPLVLSTGMSFEHEIVRAIDQLKSLQVPFALLHCNSTYPAPESDIQLGYIARLKQLHGVIGYSGHERGTAVTLAAVALGASLVERHITLDRNMEGPDHLASLEPAEFRQLVDGIRQIEKALPWSGPGRHASQGELLNRENLAKSVIAARDIAEGEVFSESALRVASPGQGLAPYKLVELLGKPANRAIAQGEFLFESDLREKLSIDRRYHFPVKWGVPVRYHDFRQYETWVKPDLFEFHLSYRDLGVDPAPYLTQVACTRLVVHAPELFENSELLDLAADDEAYRQRSIENLQRVVDATHRIAEFFPQADSLLIVANVGGFSADAPFPLAHRKVLYERFLASCAQIDFGRTELIPQNMAPFPWHFGGQRHQNIFMMPDELAAQARAMNMRLCLDLSHLQMTCNHFGLDFQQSLALLLPYSAHLHVADAKGTNGEGVVMGTGDVDWPASWKKIAACPGMGFIPEVWQGHKDHGAGFWSALEYLASLN
ncbi:N-acetylneuraminate synthase family protein [Herbaspirillum sp. VT-16-41]|uniref:N-acetylneuraminate synthase family protein n=1 Tax=Herbaspirillum sp. VT-16-41 TaxID=1953765 RepID=UPI0009822483|nr:N-acetylneuraminate synthase family protein [Herbaspirillum sp. VT-16-41]ONN67019.1 acetylneuraminic acid synthetase [Herbaspirillum sp. VT-16-41]